MQDAFVLTYDHVLGAAVVVFRQTAATGGWLSNFLLPQVDVKLGDGITYRLHAGFWSG